MLGHLMGGRDLVRRRSEKNISLAPWTYINGTNTDMFILLCSMSTKTRTVVVQGGMVAACKLQCSAGSDRHEVEDGSLRSLAGVIEPFSIAVENFAPSVDDRREVPQ